MYRTYKGLQFLIQQQTGWFPVDDARSVSEAKQVHATRDFQITMFHNKSPIEMKKAQPEYRLGSFVKTGLGGFTCARRPSRQLWCRLWWS
jgi:hypothetical protein